MARAIREYQHARFQNILAPSEPSRPEWRAPVGLVEVSQSPGWWFRTPVHGVQGGVWSTSRQRLTQVLSWCPEVLSHLTLLNHDGRASRVYYTLRVHHHVATLPESDLHQGKGWELFPTIDLWECLAVQDQLRQIVECQALHAPRIACGEAAA